jgi:hypothetical protein
LDLFTFIDKMNLFGNELTGDLAGFCLKREEYQSVDRSFSSSKDDNRDPSRDGSSSDRHRVLQDSNPKGGPTSHGGGPAGDPGGGPPGGKLGPAGGPFGGSMYFADTEISCSCCTTERPRGLDDLPGGGKSRDSVQPLDPTIINTTQDTLDNPVPVSSSMELATGRARIHWHSSSDWN